MSSPYPSELRKVTEKEKPYMEKLTSDDINLQWEAVIDIRNAIIGSRRQKANFIVMGIIVNLNTIINNPESPDGLKRDAITLLTSLSKGTNNNIVALCDYGAYRTLIDVLINSQSSVLLLATLRCIYSILSSTSAEKQPDHRTLQTKTITIAKFETEEVVARLIEVLDYEDTMMIQTSLSILKKISKLSKRNDLLIHGAAGNKLLHKVHQFLKSKTTSKDVVLLSIHLLINLMSKNFTEFILSHCDFEIEQLLSNYLHEIDLMPNSALQDDLHIAVCRCLVLILDKQPHDTKSVMVLRRLTSLCASRNPDIRIKAAFSLASLISRSVNLQNIAFYSNQLPKKIEKFFQLPQGTDGDNIVRVKKFNKELNAYSRLRCAGLTLLAALTQEDERLRTNLLSQKGPGLFRDNILSVNSWSMNALVEAITEQQDPNDPNARMVLLASLKCLRSFSRSNQHLRTTLYDSEIYDHFGRIFEQHKNDDEILLELLPILANLMLDFCPQKSDLVELTLSDITMILLNRHCPKFASLCLACLINMSHQSNGSNRYKNEIVQRISIRQIFELVETYTNSTIGSNDNITYQVICLLRNLVDENNLLVEAKGDDIIKICHFWLCGNFNWFKKNTAEPKLYLTAITHILKNISSLPDGVTKLCSNEDLIRAIVELLSDDDVNVKTQSSFIISNLLHEQATEDTFNQRQKTLRSAGLLNVIQKNPPANKYTKLNENVETILKRLGELNQKTNN